MCGLSSKFIRSFGCLGKFDPQTSGPRPPTQTCPLTADLVFVLLLMLCDDSASVLRRPEVGGLLAGGGLRRAAVQQPRRAAGGRGACRRRAARQLGRRPRRDRGNGRRRADLRGDRAHPGTVPRRGDVVDRRLRVRHPRRQRDKDSRRR